MPRVFDLIKPLDNRDTYPITDVIFQKGGLREVENITAMNAISEEKRRSGMIVFLINTKEFYALTGGDLTNSSWQKIDFANNTQNSLNLKEIITSENTNSISETVGNNLNINVTDTSILKLKNGSSLASLRDNNGVDGKILFLQNITENSITIKNNYFETLNSSLEVFDDTINLKNVAFGISNYVAVANSGSQTSRIIISTDMENWNYIQGIPNINYEDIIFNNNIFVAIASNGTNRVITSTNTINWQEVSVDANSWQSIAYGANRFVAVSSDGSNRAMYSTNGSTWTSVIVPLNSWQSVAYGANKFVAVSNDGTNRIMHSADGITWTNIASPSQNQFFKIKFLNNKFYAISENDVITSVDGLTWEILTLPFDDQNIKDIAFSGDFTLFIKNNIIYYTNNFEIWKNFSFTNTSTVNNSFFYNNYFYLFCNSRILRIKIDIIINNQYPIYTGNNIDLPLFTDASVMLQFSKDENVWRVVGSLSRDLSVLNLNDTPNQYPTVVANNNTFLSLNPDQNQADKIIFNNPFPIITNQNQDLVIRSINGLRIRRFDNTTGEIVFAKFEPTFLVTMNTPINFDDAITAMTVGVTNDSFLENNRVVSITALRYYKNNETSNLVNLTPNETLPTPNNTSFSWSSSFTFSTISDINTSFGLSPNTYNFIVTLVDNSSTNFSATKQIIYRTPFFSFTVSSVVQDFRTTITNCNLVLTYTNVTNKDNNSQITSITSNVPNNPTYTGFTNGMTTYNATGIVITEANISKTNNLSDSGTYSFTTVCRYTRPVAIDANQNFFNITANANLSVTFTYPIFVGATATTVSSLAESDFINLTDSSSISLPRSFNYTVGGSNMHWWVCLRKRYVNNRTISITLTSGGSTMTTSIINSNEANITTPTGSEAYMCYAVILQANYVYTINVSI